MSKMDDETYPSRFIDPYLAYAATVTDAPMAYHRMCAVAAVGLAVARGYGLAWAGQVLYPLVWAVLVGPPSSRKTTALAIMKRIVKLAYPERVMPESITPEAMMTELEEQPVQGMILSEMLTLLGALRRDYMGGTEGTLMELYDTPLDVTRRRVKDGVRKVVVAPGLMVVGAMTPDGFQRYARADDFGVGFLARFVFVVGARPTKELAIPPGPDEEAEARLAGMLKKIGEEASALGGRRAVLSEEAAGQYAAWAAMHLTWVDGLTDGFQSCGVKATVLPLRIGVARAADRGRMGKVVGWADVAEGCRMTDAVRDGVETLAPEMVATVGAKQARRVLRVVRKAGGRTNRRHMMQYSGLDAEELTRALRTLRDGGLLVREPDSETGRGEWWRLGRAEEGQ